MRNVLLLNTAGTSVSISRRPSRSTYLVVGRNYNQFIHGYAVVRDSLLYVRNINDCIIPFDRKEGVIFNDFLFGKFIFRPFVRK